jgi:hypothetical protein
VNPNVSPEDLLVYLSQKVQVPSTDFIVEDVTSEINMNLSKAFKVGAEFSLKDTMYLEEFWPKGVVFKRFEFRKVQQDFHPARSKLPKG